MKNTAPLFHSGCGNLPHSYMVVAVIGKNLPHCYMKALTNRSQETKCISLRAPARQCGLGSPGYPTLLHRGFGYLPHRYMVVSVIGKTLPHCFTVAVVIYPNVAWRLQ